MGKDTKIEWADQEFAPWKCKGDTRVVASEATWREPLKWDLEAKAERVRRRVLVGVDAFEDWRGSEGEGEMTCRKTGEPLCINSRGHVWPIGWPSMSDGDDWGVRDYTMVDVRHRLFRLIDATPNLDWLLLTKRPENIARMMPPAITNLTIHNRMKQAGTWHGEQYRENVWIGTTVENQQTANERIPHLLRVPARVRFLSCEPLLGPINLIPHRNADGEVVISQGINADWVIACGESGLHARPSHPEWFRSLRDQCQAAGVPFFFKQWGEWAPVTPLYDGRNDTLEDGTEIVMQRDGVWNDRDGQPTDKHAWLMRHVGKAAAGRMLDGREWNEVPECH